MIKGVPFEQAMHESFKKRPNVKRLYDAMEPEYALIRCMIEKRAKCEITQAELARKMGTKQSAISRFEAGGTNPTIGFLYKLADVLDVKLKISVV